MYPNQQQPPQQGGISIQTSYPGLAFMLGMFKPRALINGHQVQLAWGQNMIPAPPGVHQIDLWIPYMWKVGKASITVDTRSGQAPPVYYAAPWIMYMGGAIGHEPQKSPGALLAILLMVVPLAIIILCCLGSVLTNSIS